MLGLILYLHLVRTPQKIFRRFPLQGTAGDDLSNDDGEKEADGGIWWMIVDYRVCPPA